MSEAHHTSSETCHPIFTRHALHLPFTQATPPSLPRVEPPKVEGGAFHWNEMQSITYGEAHAMLSAILDLATSITESNAND